MRCAACGEEGALLTGRLRPYTNFECDIYECSVCGARFTPHVDGVHEELHAAPHSTYGFQRQLADEVASAYQAGDGSAIRRLSELMGSQASFLARSRAALAVRLNGSPGALEALKSYAETGDDPLAAELRSWLR